MTDYAAQTFAGFMLVVVLFQVALALGAPWGAVAMGGRFPGRFPTGMRIAAVVQAVFLGLLGMVVLVRAQLLLPEFFALSETGIWVVVAVMSVSLIMNLITPSRWERILWAPVVAILTTCALVVALS